MVAAIRDSEPRLPRTLPPADEEVKKRRASVLTNRANSRVVQLDLFHL